jgi:hypothetical protein
VTLIQGSAPTRRIVVTILVRDDAEDEMEAVPAIQAAIETHALNPGESIESIEESRV